LDLLRQKEIERKIKKMHENMKKKIVFNAYLNKYDDLGALRIKLK